MIVPRVAVAGLILAVLLGRAAAAAETPSVSLFLAAGGQERLLLGVAAERVSVGDADVLQVEVITDREVLVTGLSPGRSDLTVHLADGTARRYRVRVAADDAGLREAIARDPALDGVTVSVQGDVAVLTGTVASLEAFDRLDRLAGSLGGDSAVVQVTVDQPTMVSVDVKFAAIATTTLQRLGVDFQRFSDGFELAVTGPGSVGGYTFDGGLDLGVRPPPIADAFSLFLSFPGADVLGVLSALQANQMARILAEPTLTVRSGESADFIAGGDIPIPVPSGDGDIGIEFRPFGVRLDLSATVAAPDRIVLRVRPEVSDVDFTRAVTIQGTTVPAFTRRAATTTVELASGQSFILAGLISTSTTTRDESVPFLGDIPILGAFFSRARDARERQELIIVATPRLVSPIRADALPPLPGVGLEAEGRSFGDMLMRRNGPRDSMVEHGLLP